MEKRQLNPQIVESADGSHTLKVEALKEHYHSHKGALQESMHVFIAKGLHHLEDSNEVAILEVGFGTGLNALLTFFQREYRRINYTGLETVPLKWDLVQKLNYPQLLKEEESEMVFKVLHEAPWNQPKEIRNGFILDKREIAFEDFSPDNCFDLVYYDAFAPHAQPELWTPAIWEKMYGMMNDRGVLVTYCAKGQVRRDMQAVGFEVERLEGPPGKREMIRAAKTSTRHA